MLKTRTAKLMSVAIFAGFSAPAFAEPAMENISRLGVQTDSSVGRVGWAESATLALSTSAIPNADTAHRYYGRYWGYHNHNNNSAMGTVTVSSETDEMFSIAAAPLMPAGLMAFGMGDDDLDEVDDNDVVMGAFLISSIAPRIDFVHEGTVQVDMETKGTASAAGFGEALAFVDATSSQGASFERNNLVASDNGIEEVPVFGGAASATTTLFGAIGDDESGLISAVSYGAQIAGSRGTELEIDNVTVSQTVTASAGNGGIGSLLDLSAGPGGLFGGAADFTLSREADDLTLAGDVRGNGLSMIQEVERAAIAGGGVKRSVSLFETDEIDPE